MHSVLGLYFCSNATLNLTNEMAFHRTYQTKLLLPCTHTHTRPSSITFFFEFTKGLLNSQLLQIYQKNPSFSVSIANIVLLCAFYREKKNLYMENLEDLNEIQQKETKIIEMCTPLIRLLHRVCPVVAAASTVTT